MKADRGGELKDKVACLEGRMKVKPARNAFAGAGRIIHHIQWQYPNIFSKLQVTDRAQAIIRARDADLE